MGTLSHRITSTYECVSAEDLPDIWQKLTKTNSKNLCTLIQAEVNKTSQKLNLPQVIADHNKCYIKVTDVKSLEPKLWVKDGILNFLWNQFGEQHRSQQKFALLLPSFTVFYKVGG
jgi:Ulp1 family protease